MLWAPAVSYQGFAQSAISVTWQRVDNGRGNTLGAYKNLPLDSLSHVIDNVLATDRAQGYYFVQLDSAVVGDTLFNPVAVRLFVDRGPKVEVASITWSGLEAFDAAEF